MSTTHSKSVKYKCVNDCRQDGCPGHELRMIYHNTSDTIGIETRSEGNEWWCQSSYIFDDHFLDAILKAHNNDK